MSDSPIFDQLIVEFAQERDTHFPRLIGAFEIPETPKNVATTKTLYDATHLKAIRPAIPPMTQDTDATVVMEAVRDEQSDDETVTEAEVDESFDKAVKALEKPSAIVQTNEILTPVDMQILEDDLKHVTPVVRGNVTAVRHDSLPRRRNKRNKAFSTTKKDPTFSFFETDTTTSPGSAA